MFSDELVVLLKTHFPVQLSEINAAMDLLIESLDEAARVVANRGNKLSLNKEYRNAAELMSQADALYALSKRVGDFADNLQSEEVAAVSEDEVLDDIEKTYPDYSKYEVDNTVAHTLHENYVHKRPYAFELKGRKVNVTEWKRMLLETCEILADIDAGLIAGFPNNPRLNGKKSKYFRTDHPELLRSPLKLKNMEMYVETNFSANFIRNLLIKMINHYEIPLSEFKIYLRADYTGLHQGTDDNGDADEKLMPEMENDGEGQQVPVLEITGDCIKRISDYLQKPLVRRSKAIYRSYDHKTTVVCLTSSARDKGGYLDYWFGLRTNQKTVLEDAGKAYVALGCGSKNKIILIPFSDFNKWLDDMSTTGEEGNIRHWHIVVVEKGSNFSLRLKTGRQDVELTGYMLNH